MRTLQEVVGLVRIPDSPAQNNTGAGESRGGSSARDVILAERKGGLRHGMLTRLQPSSEASMYFEMKSEV